MATTCRYHCRTCDLHFASLNAFDVHRSGPWTARVCDDPDDRFVSDQGLCHISDPDLPASAGPVWGLRKHREGVGTRLRPEGRQSVRRERKKKVLAA